MALKVPWVLSISFFAAANGADWLSTAIALYLGHHELNPFFLAVASLTGVPVLLVILGVKAFIVGEFAIVEARIPPRHKRAYALGVLAGGVLLTVVAAENMRVAFA